MTKSIVADKSFLFALEIIELYRGMVAEKEFVLSKQLLRSATSIGANIEEAIGAISHKEFRAKMSIALKEARETLYWLRLIARSQIINVSVQTEIANAVELIRILTAIVKTSDTHP